MNEKYLEKAVCNTGLVTAVEGGTWNVLMLNFLPHIAPHTLDNMHKHTETKETFVLLKGKAMLFVADGDDLPGNAIEGEMLEPFVLYTVKKNVWHANVMSEDAQILLVENADTVVENTPRVKLTESQLARVRELAVGKV